MNNRQAIHCEDKEAVLPFRTKNRIVNLLFQNRELTSTTYRGTLICFLAISLIFLALSIFFFVAVAGVVEVRQQYYSTSNSDCLLNTQCAVSFQVDKAMAAPVYLMYELGRAYLYRRQLLSEPPQVYPVQKQLPARRQRHRLPPGPDMLALHHQRRLQVLHQLERNRPRPHRHRQSLRVHRYSPPYRSLHFLQ